MANARMLRRREQLITDSAALTAASPLGRAFLTVAHVVFPVFTVDPDQDHRNASAMQIVSGAPSGNGVLGVPRNRLRDPSPKKIYDEWNVPGKIDVFW